jgi:adenylate cyclase
MTRKSSLVWLAFSTFFVLFLAYYVFSTIEVGRTNVDEYEKRQTIHLINYLKLGKTLLEAGFDKDLRERLEEARTTRYLDFYILHRGDTVVYYGNKDGRLDGINFKFERENEISYLRDTAFATTKVDDLTLTVGINLPKQRYWRTLFMKAFGQITQDILVIASLVFFVLAYFLKDLLLILKSLSGSRDFSGIKTRSREADVLARGLTAYESEVRRLEEQNFAYGNQVLPSLKSEILSGRPPPYDFDCTLVRMDINGFSASFNGPDRDGYLARVNSFFEDVSHVVARYGGLIHEFVGDEVIFYFKDSDHENSTAIAASAVKDIHANVAGFGFTVKSSLAHGSLRFGRQVNGFSLAGSILIETVRVQSQITERSANTLYMNEDCARKIEFLCDMKFESEMDLKGVGRAKIWSYQSHKPLQFTAPGTFLPDNLNYYRSDGEIASILKFLAASPGLRLQEYRKFMNILNRFPVTRSTGVIKAGIIDLIDILAGQESDDCEAKLAATVTLVSNLISPDQTDGDLRNRLEKLLSSKNDRLLANTIEALSHLDARLDFADMAKEAGPRVKANALVRAGMLALDEGIITAINRMLSSKDVSELASGLFVAGELAQFHRHRDPVWFATQSAFLELIHRLKNYESHADESVRRQARRARQKACEPPARQI